MDVSAQGSDFKIKTQRGDCFLFGVEIMNPYGSPEEQWLQELLAYNRNVPS